MRLTSFSFAALLCGIALALPAHAQDMRGKLAEEIRLQRERARELEQIGNSDGRTAQDLNNQANALEEQAGRLDQRARDFKVMANAQMFNPGAKGKLLELSEQLAGYARNDRENVAFRRRVANDLATSSRGALESARNHSEQANRLQAFLDAQGQPAQQQQQPPPSSNPWR